MPGNEYVAVSPGPYPESALENPIQYSEYFTIPTAPDPSVHITAPQYYDMLGQTPATLYFSGQRQGLTYSQYAANYPSSSSLWIQGRTSWTQTVVVPQGAFLSLIALSSTDGYGYLHETYPDGRLVRNYYYFYPVSRMGFYADAVGQHILLFIIGDQVSNAIVIDVIGNRPPGYQQPSYKPPSYYPMPGYLPPFYELRLPFHHMHWPHGDNASPYFH